MTAATLTLSACAKPQASPQDGASCYPAGARRWIEAAVDGAAPARDPGGRYTVYVDGSASMVGFLRGGTAQEKPFADLIGMLPGLEGINSSGTELVRFDRKVSVIGPKDMARLQTDAGFVCPTDHRDCDAQESHLDQALSRVAGSNPSGLSVIVSDLWLTNGEVRTSEGVALAKPLADILKSGRGVAVYGFESPYNGRVYDLPSGSTGVVAKRRYLFVVAAGPPARLDALHAAMLRAPSPSISGALTSGRANYSLFTTDPLHAVAEGTQGFKLASRSPLAKTTFLPARSGVRVPQFHLDRSAALRAVAGDDAGAVWQGVSPATFRAGAVWAGASRGTTTAYRMMGDSCLPHGADWRADGSFEGGWRDRSFDLRPSDLMALSRGKYLLLGTLRRTELQTPNPATRWMRDWSFDPLGEAAAVGRPVMPTLNLGEVARLMENALAQAAEARPTDVGGFAVAVQID